MKALKTKPFKIDPKARQRFTFAGAARTFPVGAKDANTIEIFVKELTKALALSPKTGTMGVERPRNSRKVSVKSVENGFPTLSRTAERAMSVYFPKRRRKAARKPGRVAPRSSRVA